MKKTTTIFWIVTILFSGFMLFSSIPDIILNAETKTFMDSLGYPDYFTRFIGVMKVLGIIALLIPGYPRIKEWAYAGLLFDLIGAIYSLVSIYGVKPDLAFMLIPLILWWLSYYFYHKRLSMTDES